MLFYHLIFYWALTFASLISLFSSIIRATSLVLYKKTVENFICLPIHSSWVTFKIFHLRISFAMRGMSFLIAFCYHFYFFLLFQISRLQRSAFPRKVKHGNQGCWSWGQCYRGYGKLQDSPRLNCGKSLPYQHTESRCRKLFLKSTHIHFHLYIKNPQTFNFLEIWGFI